MEIYDLYMAYREARKNKRRSADQIQFELKMFERIYRLCEMVNNTDILTSSYCFIHKRGDKSREVWASDMELKILQTILDFNLRPIVEGLLTDNTFNNRKGRGTHAAINHVIEDIAAASEGYTRDCWIIKIDNKGFFPNINQDIAWRNTEKIINDNFHGEKRDLLLLLAKTVNYYNPQFNTIRRSPIEQWNEEIPNYKSLFHKPFGKGAAIGFLYWQVMTNLYPNEIDKWIIENLTPYYTRYVDDMVLITTDKEYLLSQLPVLRMKFSEIEVTMHPTKFYCQHYTKGVEFLGYHIKKDYIHVNRKIVIAAMNTANSGIRSTDRYVCQINSYLGMIKSSSDTHVAKKILESIHRDDVIIDMDRLIVKSKRYGIQ